MVVLHGRHYNHCPRKNVCILRQYSIVCTRTRRGDSYHCLAPTRVSLVSRLLMWPRLCRGQFMPHKDDLGAVGLLCYGRLISMKARAGGCVRCMPDVVTVKLATSASLPSLQLDLVHQYNSSSPWVAILYSAERLH